jgi:adenine-specific DNA-methyltransferase
MSVRLEWEGKPTEVERLTLPFQTVETINQSRATRDRDSGSLWAGEGPGGGAGAPNQLVWGDNKLVMGSLLKDHAGKIDLIYVDPPFATDADFTYDVKVGPQKFAKQPSVLEETAYRDTWGHGADSFLSMIYSRVLLMHELLAEGGSFYIHLDSREVHYVKVVCDEVFGRENFMREIVWRIGWISGYKAKAANWARNHETILFYVKDRENFTFNKKYIEHDAEYQRGAYGSEEMGELQVLDDDGTDVSATTGKPMDDVWVNLPSIQIMSFSQEKTGYPTQKNTNLIRRIVESSSNPGDLVADFFCGAGSTLVAAEELGRRWLGCDLGRFAIHTTRKRLLDIPDCKPFEIRNLGAYERQRWQRESGNGQLTGYLDTILAFYKAEPVEGFANLHGQKAGRMVHIGATDAPVTIDELEEVMDEMADNGIESCDVLGWEWEMGLHDTIGETARRRGLDLRPLQIPREIIEPGVRAAGAVRFFELAHVDLDVKRSKREVSVVLKDFAIPSEELIPPQVRDRIESWSDLIDYWSVDFDYTDDTFHNQWQAYRTREEPKLARESDPHEYEEPGRHTIVVKIIDIFGNDTTKLAEVAVK